MMLTELGHFSYSDFHLPPHYPLIIDFQNTSFLGIVKLTALIFKV